MAMIKVKFELLGAVRSPFGRKFEIELKKGMKISDFLIKKLKYKKEVVLYFACVVNGKKTVSDRVLKDGDKVKILLPVAGG
jgi:molybdopterin converting factor small subunit